MSVFIVLFFFTRQWFASRIFLILDPMFSIASTKTHLPFNLLLGVYEMQAKGNKKIGQLPLRARTQEICSWSGRETFPFITCLPSVW